jgi:DNA (cytosine-5)-methyltransferase 1
VNYYGLFEGISGLGLAFKRAGATIQAVCEIDKTCQSVLRRHHPEAEVISNVKAINKDTFQIGAVDILCGGFTLTIVLNPSTLTPAVL